ncbi:hypothetical protein ACI7BZ_18450 [Xanthobacter sp. AM11]|uniref:hypothetical protein n=1 Tax=Xanthobacter sp. AM11 TaxID=3380643 RepID=UPI0039BFE708
MEITRIYALLGRAGSALQRDLKPAMDRPVREALVAAGFLTARKDKAANNALRLELTEAGWNWARKNLGAPSSLPGGAGVILHDWMAALARYMAASGVPLIDILCPRPATDPQPEPPPPAAPLGFEQVYAAAFALGGGQAHVRVRLKDLRRALPDASREQLDGVLRQAADEGRIVLYPLDDPRGRSAEDDAASISLGGMPAHILYLN